jgi:formate--tetrahydrofolate ligase
VLLKNALAPNLVQTLENTPAIIHGGPFANIAHGCNSVIATTTGMKLADYVVTEAGFGADLGAEKFIDIKCRKSGLRPNVVVIVATVRALKYHGGFDVKTGTGEDLVALEAGLVNLERHVSNVKNVYGLPVVVAINKFTTDTQAEIELLRSKMAAHGVDIVLASHWAEGGAGAVELANKVVEMCEGPSTMTFTYPDSATLWEKTEIIAKRVYGASGIDADEAVKARFADLQAAGYGEFPVCIAKTQYSFSTDAKLRGAPSDHVITVRELRLSAGAEFVVAICGDVMTMPGLPKVPAAERIDVVDGKVVGLF